MAGQYNQMDGTTEYPVKATNPIKPYLTDLTDYEECRAWEFDLVAIVHPWHSGSGTQTSVCKVRWFVNDKSDKPFYKEAVVGGDRYGTPTSTLHTNRVKWYATHPNYASTLRNPNDSLHLFITYL